MSAGRHLGIALVDQAMLSAANFGIALLLINAVPKADYGLFVIANTVILLVVGYQNALVTTQMTVLTPRKPAHQQAAFCAALGLGQYGIFLPLALVAMMLAISFYTLGKIDIFQFGIIVIGVMAMVPILRREFLRSLFFLRLSPRTVLTLDMVFVGVTAIAILLVYWLAREHLVLGALAGIGVGSLAAWVVGEAIARLPKHQTARDAKIAVAAALHQGKWAAGGVTVTNVQAQSYVYLLALFGGGAYVAEAAAARLFLTPVAILSTSATKTLMPRWAIALREQGKAAVERVARKVLLILLVIVVVYVAVLLLASDLLTGWLLTPEYQQIGPILALWGGVFFVQAVRTNQSIQLQIAQRFKTLMKANAVSAAVVIVTSLWLISRYGAPGAVGSMLVGEVILTWLLFVALRKGAIGNAN